MSILVSWSLWSICESKSLHSSLTDCHTVLWKERGCETIFCAVVSLSLPLKGTPEPISAYRMTPRLQMSDLKSEGSSWTTSGAMKPIVPAIFLMHSSSPSLQARPKSPILTLGLSAEASLRKMFKCFRSLCTMPFEWISERPWAI